MIIHLTILISALFLMYQRTFKYGYIIDDMEVEKPKTEETKNYFKRVWEHLKGCKYTDSKLGHMIATILHMTNCVLIYFVFGANDISFFTALLFGMNPVTNQAAIWLSGKPYAISTMLLLLGMLIKPLLPFTYGFCVWWAPNSLFFPLLFLIQKPHFYLILLPIIGWYSSKRFRGVFKTRIAGGTNEMTVIKPKKLIILFKTLGYYFCHCLFPLKLGMCHKYMHTFGLSEKETKPWYKIDGFFFLGIGLVIASIIVLFHSSNPLAYGLFWFVLLTVQWCNVVMVNHPITERYIYLSTIGLMYLLVNLVITTPFIWVFLAFYVTRLYYFMPAYRDIKSFWKSNIENFPDVAMGYNQYGLGLINYGNTGSAIDTLIQGVQVRPDDFRINYNLANVMIATGNTQTAIPFLKKAEDNLDKKNNYEFWVGQINLMKEELKRRGIDYEHSFPAAPVGSQA